eukprot:TRINITY_DN26617_c0_g1_i1.p1 TRINITY_DN26617_c0_g1~~TRINITY_DN26617_c0_g1_i1.p1  ORF type:complete len:257 (+),score=51.92 TRINITY_DN26617_c0_g1_i1:25-795(+)
MALCPGDTTEWDDIQRKFGNFAPLKKETPQREIERALVEAAEQLEPLEGASLQELNAGEDDVDEDMLEKYRRQRMAELKAAQKAARFGELLQVTRTNFVREVTDASAGGQWVLVLLYVEASPQCHPIMKPWAEAARRFAAIKFMKGVASEVIPDFPDSCTPTVIVYKDTDCVKQIQGLEEWGGGRCSVDTVEWVLADIGAVETDLEEDPRLRAIVGPWAAESSRLRRQEDKSEEEDPRDDRGYSSMRLDRTLRGKR